MATSRNSGGRKRPQKKRIKYFDGFIWRNANPDVDLIVSRNTTSSVLGVEKQFFFPIIPQGEIRIDRVFKKEAKLLKAIYRLEKKFGHLSEKELRALIARKLVRGTTPTESELVVSEETICLGNAEVRICYVRGCMIRKRIDPWFILGGHDLVYKYVLEISGKNTIWIDIDQDPREIIYTRFHEIEEWAKMKWSRLSYNAAHKLVTVAEWEIRGSERDDSGRKPLRMTPLMQSSGLCGPTSAAILLGYHGKVFTEQGFNEICGADPEKGADHTPLVRGMRKIGATVFEKTGGTLEELEYFVHEERLPVMVGWWPDLTGPYGFDPKADLDETGNDWSHYSVAYHVNKHVYLMDPDAKSGVRKLSRKAFLKRWFDTDQPADRNLLVHRWYMVPNFKGKKSDVPGGTNHDPLPEESETLPSA